MRRSVGLAIGLVNPQFSKKTKLIVTIIMVVLSWYLSALLIKSLGSLKQYYGLLMQINP